MPPFEIRFSREPRTTFDTLVPHVDDTEISWGFDAFIEQCKQILRDLGRVLNKQHHEKVKTKQMTNAQITRRPAGISVKPGD